MKTAVFIDTMSIQNYIFSSNSLKENIGASFIVKSIFDELKSKFKYSYIGGGNALLYFDNEEEGKEAMKEWSRKVLKEYPGIKPIIVIESKFDENNYSISRSKIIRKSFAQKNQFIPVTTISSFGFTAECHRTGLSSEVFSEDIDDNTYISSQSYTKLKASKASDKMLKDEFKDILGDNKDFPNEFDKLGGSKGENNHIAVVHIDGNDIGEKIKNIETERELVEFSQKLEKATKESFKEMLRQLVSKWNHISEEFEIKDNNLPVRPIIIGGDDITFVCDARLGLFLTYNFIKNFEEQELCRDNNITACGGISIVKTKYPFYRAYNLAEELCANAKKKRKEKDDVGSWIDFHISFGGIGGNLEKIREEHYKTNDNNTLYRRPYSLKEIPPFLRGINDLNKLPQSKVKQLREVLYDGENSTKDFIKELEYRNNKLPIFSHSDESEKGFVNGITPYIDMIEMTDFCPDFFLKEAKSE